MTNKPLKTLIVLFKTQKNLNKHIKKSLEGSGLSVNEFSALEVLYNKGDLSVHQLINYVLIPNSSMTYVVSTLATKGYLEVCPNPQDQRVKFLKLTEKGRIIFENAYNKHYQHLAKEFEVLSKDEEATLRTLLKKLGKSLEENL